MAHGADLVAIQGHSTTTGLLKYAGTNIATDDCLLVKILRDAGAGRLLVDRRPGYGELTPVFYCKTAIPQAAMHLETDSFVGTCINPYNRELTAGGSSGGEAVLLALGASVLGKVIHTILPISG